MKANAIKTQIIDTYNQFAPIAKMSDVKADIRGIEYRVVIKKGEVQKVVADNKPVWTPESGVDVLDFLEGVVHPVAIMKTNIIEENKMTKETKKSTKKEKAPKAEKKIKEPKVKAEQHVIDDKWVAYLLEEANKSKALAEGDRIQFRVATSHGKPVCAHIDLYRGDTKVATAGIHHRIGFATHGVNQRWLDRVDIAIKSIYSRVGSSNVVRKDDAMVQFNEDGTVQRAEGSVASVLEILTSK